MTDASAPINIDARDGAVETILAARRSGTTFESLDPNAPQSSAQSYAIDDRVAELLDAPVLGWKIGCTSELAQKILGTDGPMCGRVYETHPTAVTLPMADYPGAYLEGEFAFTLAAALPPRSTPYTLEEASAAVASAHPCIEVVGGRCSNFLKSPIDSVIADAGANSALVVGDAIDHWRDIDFANTPGSMTIDGTETGSGTGADVLGNPLLALTWLANHLSQRGIGLRAGDIVSTGTCTGVVAAAARTSVLGDFEIVGQVEVHFE